MTLRYACDRELRAMAGKANIERTHATGLVVASAIFILLGVYGLVFSALYDLGLIPLIVLSLVSIVTGLGVFLGRRFALWLSLLLFPLAIVETFSTLFYSVTLSGWYSSDIVTVFNASLILYAIGLVISLLLVIDKRSQLK
jgi:nitrogen fixation/metabolism regulation signal transduction histidine kinase